jgi:hypothetical protein
MKLDLASFAFGAILIEGTGTPPWGTSFGQNNPDYKFVREGHEEIIVGMLYNAVDLNTVSLPLGKGGCFYKASEKPIVQLASVFNNVFVNGEKIDYPFTMVILKDDSLSHYGRRHLKYSPKISYRGKNGYVFTNDEFIQKVRKHFHLTENACWFIHEIKIENQNVLHMSAVFVNKDKHEVYQDSKERKQKWQKILEKAE